MGRWTQYDEDAYRLPEGMKRVGYDADTGRYFFRSKDGSLWEGAEGAQYSEMTKVSDAPAGIVEASDDIDDVETGPVRADGYTSLSTGTDAVPRTENSYRVLFPFFLIIIVVLLLVWRLTGTTRASHACPAGSTPSTVVAGDTCWDIAQVHGCALDALLALNPALRCEHLRPGDRICVPA
ncbi:carbohydrate-binding module family 50 protein [Auriscalpium vulgare]|uniref:Carbohydrate-binding module family 50 protein n=1 Tax=Auriscalpium vulgare TaxID=40419 RepID=A0ACB8RDI8_9AGAM|nr:carbohydrate-binding module family 50 protein [Auriscalpium vulgare]